MAHKLEFLALKFMITDQFHKYLYCNTFVICMGNNPLTHITIGLLVWQITLIPELLIREDRCRYHCFIPHSEGEHNQHIKADSVHALISHIMQGTILIEAYSCNIQVTESLDMKKDPKPTSLEDWIIAKSKDPVIRKIKYLINENKLKCIWRTNRL